MSTGQVSASDVRFRALLTGGDRRSIANSNRARRMVERTPELVRTLAALTDDEDWLVSLRALDLLEKLAHDHPEWVMPYKRIFVGPLATSDKWEIRLQIVRALPLFRWSPAQMKRVEAILRENAVAPSLFVRAWAVDSLATLSGTRTRLRPIVDQHLWSSSTRRARRCAHEPGESGSVSWQTTVLQGDSTAATESGALRRSQALSGARRRSQALAVARSRSQSQSQSRITMRGIVPCPQSPCDAEHLPAAAARPD